MAVSMRQNCPTSSCHYVILLLSLSHSMSNTRRTSRSAPTVVQCRRHFPLVPRASFILHPPPSAFRCFMIPAASSWCQQTPDKYDTQQGQWATLRQPDFHLQAVQRLSVSSSITLRSPPGVNKHQTSNTLASTNARQQPTEQTRGTTLRPPASTSKQWNALWFNPALPVGRPLTPDTRSG